MTRKNNSCVCVCVHHFIEKEGRHWSDLSLLRQTSERGSEAHLSGCLDGLSDLSGGDS